MESGLKNILVIGHKKRIVRLITILDAFASFFSRKNIIVRFIIHTSYLSALFHITSTSITHIFTSTTSLVTSLPTLWTSSILITIFCGYHCSRRMLSGIKHVRLWTVYPIVLKLTTIKKSVNARWYASRHMHNTLTISENYYTKSLNSYMWRRKWWTELAWTWALVHRILYHRSLENFQNSWPS